MSAEALAHVWNAAGVTAEERLALLYTANNSGGLGYPVMLEWIGLSSFMCCGYERASEIVGSLADRGILRWDGSYVWIEYGGELFPPVDFTREPKGRSSRVVALIERDGAECRYCGRTPINYHVDHFIPRCLGGADSMDNLVLSCPPCNLAKSGLHPSYFCPSIYHSIARELEAYGQ